MPESSARSIQWASADFMGRRPVAVNTNKRIKELTFYALNINDSPISTQPHYATIDSH